MRTLARIVRGLVLTAALGACASMGELRSAGDPEAAIRNLLATQTAAWNRGDIPAFMHGYWADEKLRFASGNSVATGWKQTLARYRSRYGDKAAMGRLEFTAVQIEALGPDSAYAFGHWKLVRAKDQPQGLFTLILRRIKGEWLIVHDHTSGAQGG
jgi:ketosteroid isomerase-like protein